MSPNPALHPTTPDGFCIWLDWCTRPECNRPTTPEDLIAAGGEWTWGTPL